MASILPTSHAPPPTQITCLISGTGSNLQALIDATTSGLLPSTTIIRVISNKKGVLGLTRAEEAGIPTAYHNLIFGKYLKSGEKDQSIIQEARKKYDADLADLVLADKPDVVVCAGWMHILAPSFLDPLSAAHVPVINLHPALPGKYDGINAIKRAWEDFQEWERERRKEKTKEEDRDTEGEQDEARTQRRQKELEHSRTGVMIHYVISEVDRGEPIVIEYVDFKPGESLEELTERIHEVEHVAIVKGAGLAIVRLWEERRKRGLIP